MKKLILLVVVIFIYVAQLVGADIEFTFANTTLSGSTFEVDVMVQATANGTKLGDTQVYINYDTNAFGTNIVGSGKVTVSKGTMLHGGSPPFDYYTIVNVADNSSSRFAITSEYNQPGYPDYGNDLPTAPTQLLHIVFTIANNSYTADLSFQQALMDGQQYESTNSTAYVNVTADDTNDSPLSPIVVDLISFSAEQQEGNVLLNWSTVSEINHAGFNIYRQYTEENEFTRINDRIIFSDPVNSTSGAEYNYVDALEKSGEIFYKLQSVEVDGSVSFSEVVSVSMSSLIAEKNALPDQFALLPNFPNPFNPETRIEYMMPSNGFVRLALYNLQGQKIKELVNEMKNVGAHTVVWNGLDDSGQLAGSGIYMLRMNAGKFQSSRWITLLR
jgi:hypothetical protein